LSIAPLTPRRCRSCRPAAGSSGGHPSPWSNPPRR
jgi:hypothetical protein